MLFNVEQCVAGLLLEEWRGNVTANDKKIAIEQLDETFGKREVNLAFDKVRNAVDQMLLEMAVK